VESVEEIHDKQREEDGQNEEKETSELHAIAGLNKSILS
jgi:hypothetical protein